MLPAPGEEQSLLGPSAGPSEATRELVDTEVRRIVDECYERAVARLREHRDALDALARALLERETLDEVDAYRVAGVERPAAVALDGGVPSSAGPALRTPVGPPAWTAGPTRAERARIDRQRDRRDLRPPGSSPTTEESEALTRTVALVTNGIAGGMRNAG